MRAGWFGMKALGVLALCAVCALPAFAQTSTTRPGPRFTLVQALVCEEVRDTIPQNPAVSFSISAGKIYCYTLFDHVGEDTVVYHHWIFRDRPSSRIRLTLKPPRWSTFSSIQLREADKGPWRVEISDSTGRVLKTLRFSITD
jgi:hypothetical protein